MEARHDDVVGLLHLQKIDLDILKQKKQLDELPQRGMILAARKKRAAVEQKRSQVDAIKKDAAGRLSRINDEDAVLARKAQDVQSAIDSLRGDFRSVESRTKELAGIAKRRETLESERAKVDGELAKIGDIEAQVLLALEEIDAAEQRAVASFQKEGGALKASLAQLDRERAQVAAQITPEVERLYEKTAARSGGVAVGVLNGSQCGVCRASLEGGRLIELKSQAPLGVCPVCRRLLVVE